MQSFRTWYYWEIEGTVTLKIRSKEFQFSKATTCMGAACNFALNKVFAILVLSFLVMNVTGFAFPFMIYAKQEVYEATISLTVSIYDL